VPGDGVALVARLFSVVLFVLSREAAFSMWIFAYCKRTTAARCGRRTVSRSIRPVSTPTS